jgi:hypothetical protein
VQSCLLFLAHPESAPSALSIFLGLVPIIMVVVAWKWSGKWLEAFSGAVFIAYGIGVFISSLVSEHVSFVGYSGFVWMCSAIIIGVLFILAYARGSSKT